MAAFPLGAEIRLPMAERDTAVLGLDSGAETPFLVIPRNWQLSA